MSDLLQFVASGAGLGALYALIALGFVVIYRASQVFNFAQGELVMLGAFIMVSLTGWGVPWPIALILTMVANGLVGMLIERSVLRPLVGRPIAVPLIVTIIVGTVIRTAVLVIWGPFNRGMPTPWETTASVNVFGAEILVNSMAALVAAGLGLGAYFALIQYTRIGLAMRASSSDQEAALGVGIPVGRVLSATWFLAAAYAALAGVFLSMFPRGVDTNIGLVALVAFPAVIVGGLESAVGAVIAGVGLGILEVLTQAYVNTSLGSFGQNFHTVFPYVVMIVFLMVRPYGLFGRHEIQRV